jgi:PAS domain S-box-containing protein
MPFSSAFEKHHLIERTRRVRQNPLAAYGAATLAVIIATFARQAVGGQVMEGIPFITYYPAIIIAALIGGFWPGLFATALSAFAAWYLFIPPALSFELDKRELLSLLMFFFVAGINVVIIALLDGAVERVMAQEHNMRVLIESAPNGIVVVDEQGVIRLVNTSAEKLFGYSRTELVGNSIEILVPGPFVDTHPKMRQLFQQKPETRAMGIGRDLSGRRKDGTEFPVEVGLNPVRRNGNNAVLATVIDITARKQAQDSQKLIIRELQHRTQNLFAVFQAVAARAVDESKTAAEIKLVLNGRVQALARAYAMLADAAWEGASLAAILDRQFAGFSNRVNVSGCEIILNPSAVQQFALIVHELATNALKYGALSAETGRVSIEGKIDRLEGARTFSFVWRETGGPSPTIPTRKGFGTVILLDSAKQFSQSVAMDFMQEGLRYEVQLQLGAIEASAEHPSSALISKLSAHSA